MIGMTSHLKTRWLSVGLRYRKETGWWTSKDMALNDQIELHLIEEPDSKATFLTEDQHHKFVMSKSKWEQRNKPTKIRLTVELLK